ncbi:MAG: cell division protein FtsZ [Myxococcales bacterium SG8_38]|nr:MAG: cell division protein FtsZ [Myxococcales bacterium SG8_38]
MGISIEFADDAELQARIKVVGIGGSGGNALNTMIRSGLEGVEFIAANTDAQALDRSLAQVKIQLGPTLTRGLGAGGNPDVGRKAALEDVQRISEALEGADMVFITAGMGGGTGTGAAPIISQIAQDQGALTVGVVTKPFLFEGRKRAKNAERGVQELSESIDSIITIPNQRLMSLGDDDITMLDAFARADDVLLQAVQGISDLIINAGMINVDFADVKTIMVNNGRALMGTGIAKGDRRALEAAEMAINSPLLDEVSVQGATGILINFTAGPDIKLREINEAAGLVQQAAHEEAEIIFGVVTDSNLSDTVKVTVIATGFERGAHAPIPLGLHHGASSSQAANGASANRAIRQTSSRSDDLSSTLEGVPATVPQTVGTRAFGASALHDEAVLDIPAYLRRGRPGAE